MTQTEFDANLDGHLDASLSLLRYVYGRTERALARIEADEDAFWAQEPALPEVLSRQKQLREAVRTSIGLPPGPNAGRTPSRVVQERDSLAGDGFRVQPILIETSLGTVVSALRYVPDAASDQRRGSGGASGSVPGPAVLFLTGHTADGKADEEYQRACAQICRQGITVLATDAIGQGERHSYLSPDGDLLVAPGTTEHSYVGIQCWAAGTTAARFFVEEAQSLLDLLIDDPDVDADRVGITGQSGGGLQATLVAAVDQRIRATAIATFISSRGAYLWSGQRQDAEQTLTGGTERGIDHAQLLACMAPNPVAVLAAESDFFPIEGAVDTVAGAGRWFGALGDDRSLELHRDACEHSYSPAMAARAAEFFARSFGLDAQPVTRLSEPFTPAALQATRGGQVLLERPHARTIHDLLPTAAPVDAHRLRSAVLDQRMSTEQRMPTPLNVRWIARGHIGEDVLRHGFWQSERDLWNSAVYVGPPADATAITIVVQGTGDRVPTAEDMPERASGEGLLYLDTRGIGAVGAHDKDDRDPSDLASVSFKLLSDLIWLGDSLQAGRAWDALVAAAVVRRDLLGPAGSIRMTGTGTGAYTAWLAHSVDDSIELDVELDRERVPTLADLAGPRLYDAGTDLWQIVMP
ncbi:alpha/beta hydrolase family protein [Glaciibacter superstes]|uniref:alpha/beta hydrolase family protein n=1 Tax=Glaciibacter superstes TaxID=501023 RepID=UPI0003B3F21E|nr:acetylxylan esterase [Glaciibacter superstes]